MREFDTTGRRCALIGKRCPGRGIMHAKGGCPEWVDGEPIDNTINGVKESVIFKGCQRLLFRPLMRGIMVKTDETAASFDQARNQLAMAGQSSYSAMLAAAALLERAAGGEDVRRLAAESEAVEVPDEVRDAGAVP